MEIKIKSNFITAKKNYKKQNIRLTVKISHCLVKMMIEEIIVISNNNNNKLSCNKNAKLEVSNTF